MPDALMRAIGASGSLELETLVPLVTQPVEQDSTSSMAERRFADDHQRLLRAVGVVLHEVAGAVCLCRDHGPRVSDQVVHVGRDAAALLLLLVEVV